MEDDILRRILALEQRLDAISYPERETLESAAWRGSNSMYMALMGLRGFWPMSTINGSGAIMDLSGQSRTLTAGGALVAGADGIGYDGLAPYYNFGGACYLYRADEAGLDITGSELYVITANRGLTIGGWFYPTDAANAQHIMSKWGAAAGNYSYALTLSGAVAGDPVRFTISDDGTNTDDVASTTGYSTSTWQFFAGRFQDSDTGTELSVWNNDELTQAATARNSIFNGNANFCIGARSGGTSLYTGRASMCFLCAAALSDDQVWYIYHYTRALFGV